MKGLGLLRVNPATSSGKTLLSPDNMVVKQVWPEKTTLTLGDDSLVPFLRSASGKGEGSLTPSQIIEFLGSHAIYYDWTNTTATHTVLYNQAVDPDADYEWCPILPVDSPYDLKTFIEERRPTWDAPVPQEKAPNIRVVANGKLMDGITLKKEGKRHYLALKRMPTAARVDRFDLIVRVDDGWFVPRSTGVRVPNLTSSQPATLSHPVEDTEKTPVDNVPDLGAILANKRRLFFHPDDLVLLYASLRAGQFIVLGGVGGIGKSSLALEIAQFLGCEIANGRLAWLAVEPSWVCSEQVMGHYDVTARIFRPAAGQLVDLLLHAARFPDMPHVVCLDELNLARVEHYLAPLLSLKEHSASGQLGWPLYSRTLEGECLNREQYPPNVAIPPNVFWLGTINMDEASYGLTDKFLDRVTYLALRTVPFASEYNPQEPDLRPIVLPLAPPQRASLTPEEVNFFDNLNRLSAKPLVGWRTMHAMRLILGAIDQIHGPGRWNRSKAWDEIIAARVLSRFWGTGLEWEHWQRQLPALEASLSSTPWGRLDRCLEVLSDIRRTKEFSFGI
ncbi:MAG: hypothetical protein OWU33_13590 [Firmicutes bacterium]|nr:hypothetical protein [Bacillota bacterium]